MQVFLELSRTCNMECSHCLRGVAQNQKMSNHIIYKTLRMLDHLDIGIGGGEPLASKALLQNFKNVLLQNLFYLDRLYLVTNGKSAYRNPSILSIFQHFPSWEIELNVSVDKFHEPGGLNRARFIEEEMTLYNNDVQVYSHGETSYSNLIHMGKSSGKDVKICITKDLEDGDDLLYVDIHGNVWPSCDLSYTFMRKFKNTPICLGNVLTHNFEEIKSNLLSLTKYTNRESIILVNEDSNGLN